MIQNVSESHKKAIHLIIAGGYDSRVTENIEYHAELVKLADELQVKDYVSFVKSCSDTEKYTLLRLCTCLIYTPDKEHFGIVPIEAMQAGKPVIAVNSGGPKETVVDGKTGILCNPDEESFAAAMERFVNNKFLSKVMGTAAKEHVSNKFSFQAFSDNLNAIVSEMLNTDS